MMVGALAYPTKFRLATLVSIGQTVDSISTMTVRILARRAPKTVLGAPQTPNAQPA